MAVAEAGGAGVSQFNWITVANWDRVLLDIEETENTVNGQRLRAHPEPVLDLLYKASQTAARLRRQVEKIQKLMGDEQAGS